MYLYEALKASDTTHDYYSAVWCLLGPRNEMKQKMSSGGRGRKLQEMVVCKEEEQRRRSPRISAKSTSLGPLSSPPPPLQEAVKIDLGSAHNGHGQAKAMARKKRKLRPLEDVTITCSVSSSYPNPNPKPKMKQSGKQLHSQHHLVDDDVVRENDSLRNQGHDQQTIVPYLTELPDKRILGLILDILQRRDTHEIFAEPVDPEKVEDYYKFIEEPMDFGTMRAKLHEGMYTTLQQFEHDAYLIPRNAMSFNSSTTIYFKQAQAIHELAKKVFHTLKSDPDNFELEFTETRRRTCRRDLGVTGRSYHSPCPKLPANTRPRNLVLGVAAARAPPRPLRRSSNLRRHSQINPGSSITTGTIDAKEVLSGTGVDDKRCDFPEEDRRCTYRPWADFLNEKGSVLSPTQSSPKQLVHVNGRNIGYRESLMLFVKNLGPTVQMMAQRKLQGLLTHALSSETPSPKIPLPSTSIQVGSGVMSSLTTTSDSQDPRDYFHDRPTGLSRAGLDLNGTDEGKKACSSEQISIFGGFGEMTPKKNNINKLGDQECLLGTALWNPKSSMSECRLSEGHNLSWSSCSNLGSTSQCLTGDGSDQVMPKTSGFVFDLPFLKTRLEQINSAGLTRGRFSDQGSSSKEGWFLGKRDKLMISSWRGDSNFRL